MFATIWIAARLILLAGVIVAMFVFTGIDD